MLNRITPFLSKDMHALKSSKFYHVPLLEFRLKCNLYQILSGTKHFPTLTRHERLSLSFGTFCSLLTYSSLYTSAQIKYSFMEASPRPA